MAGGSAGPQRVRALLDVQLSHEIAKALRARGLDVDAVTERADIPNDTSDERLLEFATGEDRAMVTNNVKDFRPIGAARLQRGVSHAGLILVPSTRSRTRSAALSLAYAIEQVMRAEPDGLTMTERWLAPLPGD